MKKLVLPFVLVPDTNLKKLQRALPMDYMAKRVPGDAEHPEKFHVEVIYNGEEKFVAKVVVVDKEFVFEVEDDAFSSTYFNDWMTRVYPGMGLE